MDITLINTNDCVEVHKTGCPDIPRVERKHGWLGEPASSFNFDFETRWDAWYDYNSDFMSDGSTDPENDPEGYGNGWRLDFKPCTNKLPNGVWPEYFGVTA